MSEISFKEERSQQRKEEIIKVATKVFREKGFLCTLEEIANELKYTKGSIYYYFNSKEELLFECHQRGINMALERVLKIAKSDLSPEDKLKEIIKSHVFTVTDDFSVVVQHAHLFELKYIKETLAKRHEYEDAIKNVVKEGIDQKVFKANVDQSLIVLLILGAANWVPQWYKAGGRLSIIQIADFYADYLVAPLLK